MTPITRFRNSAKAIIIVDGRLLVVKIRDDEAGDFCVLPGGGQEPGETLPETLRRECFEEIGTTVTVHELCFVRDYIGRNHDFARKDHDLHLVELLFRCELDDPDRVGESTVPDTGQIGVEWLDIDRLAEYRFVPAALHTHLQAGINAGIVPRYLGDID